MPGTYACHNCGQLVGVEVGMNAAPFPEGGGQSETVTVKCPHCGAENTFLVPKQVLREEVSTK